jgi:hypothetical protein
MYELASLATGKYVADQTAPLRTSRRYKNWLPRSRVRSSLQRETARPLQIEAPPPEFVTTAV